MSNEFSVRPIGTRVSQWGEGPSYVDGRLVYVDIEGHALVSLNPETGEERTWEMGERIGTVAPVESGGFLCAGDSGIYFLDPDTGERRNLADPEADKRPDNRFNDGKCDPAGRFWAGTISTVKKTGDANLYCLGLDGELELKVPGVTNSNGICWNTERGLAYYVDTPTKKVVAYRYDGSTGEISEPEVAVDTESAGFDGSPDGMTIDSEGKLWIAMCHAGAVLRVDPDSSEVLARVDFPCVETTSCAFGGSGQDRLFVTTGLHNTLQESDAGKAFVVDGLGVSGAPAYPYRGPVG